MKAESPWAGKAEMTPAGSVNPWTVRLWRERVPSESVEATGSSQCL